ncbi:MAG: thioredoxin fold domain-containing protein [Betaproteobacteria bacterium]|nr:thioredoxin fold domain-containing protein [Betaproteobacteria bacterium]
MTLALRRLALFALFAALAGARAFGQDVDRSEDFFRLFLGDLRAEAEEARTSGRKGVVVMYHFEACPYCARMRREVLSRQDVQDWYRREFVAVAIDTRGSQPITGFDGRALPENDYARAVSVHRTPTFDFYDVDGKPLYRHSGGIYNPAEFIRLGQFVADGAYRAQSFTDYLRTPQKKER